MRIPKERQSRVTDSAIVVCALCGDAQGAHCPDWLCRTCEECDAEPGRPCEPSCTAPYSSGGPLEDSES